jgi:hypothetical protein
MLLPPALLANASLLASARKLFQSRMKNVAEKRRERVLNYHYNRAVGK